VNLHAESSKKESAIVGTNNPSHSTPVGINTRSPYSIPAVNDLKHSNCNNQFMFSDFMPEVPYTLPKEKRHLNDEVKPVQSPLVDSHGADVGGTTMNSEGVSQVHQSSASSTSAVGNVIPTAGVGQDLSQERVASNNDNDSVDKPILFSYVDIVDMSAHKCCGFSYILHLVDPIARVGHATPMKTNSSIDVMSGFRRLMSLSKRQPTMKLH
jgi:hypothetical protein